MIPAMTMASEGRAARPHSTSEVISSRVGIEAGCAAAGSENRLYRDYLLSRMFDMFRLRGLLLIWFGLWAQPLHAQIAAHILLQDSPLAGFQYHAGKQLWSQMQVGDGLTLIREPDNPYDAKAVRIEWQGHKIGYVPRRDNADAARFMDSGQMLEARISRLAEGRDPWSRVRFEILIPVQPRAEKP
jgi:hypothetical protein